MTHTFGSSASEAQSHINNIGQYIDIEAELDEEKGYFFRVKGLKQEAIRNKYKHSQFSDIPFGTLGIELLLSNLLEENGALGKELGLISSNVYKVLYRGITYEVKDTCLNITGEAGCCPCISSWPMKLLKIDNTPDNMKISGPMKYTLINLFLCKGTLDLTESDIDVYYQEFYFTLTLPQKILFAPHPLRFPQVYRELFDKQQPEVNDNVSKVTFDDSLKQAFSTKMGNSLIAQYTVDAVKQCPDYFQESIFETCCRI